MSPTMAFMASLLSVSSSRPSMLSNLMGSGSAVMTFSLTHASNSGVASAYLRLTADTALLRSTLTASALPVSTSLSAWVTVPSI